MKITTISTFSVTGSPEFQAGGTYFVDEMLGLELITRGLAVEVAEEVIEKPTKKKAKES